MFSPSLIAVCLLQVFPSTALWIPEELRGDASFWVPEDFTPFAKRQESTCGGIADLNPCGNDFPSDFCCPSNTQCLLLNTTSTITAALCCPAGQDCAAIGPVDCDKGLQNATTNAKSQLHSDPTADLLTCGSGGKCCPMGYQCQGSVCLAQSKADAAASSSSTPASSSILPTTTSPPLSTTTSSSDGTTITPVPLGSAVDSSDSDSFSGKSFAAGFVPGIVLGALIAAGLVLWCLRRRDRKSRSYIDEKHYSTGRDTLTDLGPESDVDRRPTFHGRSISEPRADMNLGHRTDFYHSSPPRDEESGTYGGLHGYTVHVQSPAKAYTTPAGQDSAPRSKGWLSRSPFVNQVQIPVPTQSPVPNHLKRGTLSFKISPVRALRKQRSMHSLRRQMTNATTRSNSAGRQQRPDHSRTESTETIRVLMDTPDTTIRHPPPNNQNLPSTTYQPPLPSANTWFTTTSGCSSTSTSPIDDTPTRPGRNSNVANVGATLQSPYTPSNYPTADQHDKERKRLTGLLLPEMMAGDRDSAWRNTAMTTFSSMMEKAGWRRSALLGEGGGGSGKLKEKQLVLGPDSRRWNQ